MIHSNGLTIEHEQGKQNLLALHQSNPLRYPFLLESVADSSDKNSPQFDILFAFPQETLTLSNRGDLSHSDYTNASDLSAGNIQGNDFLNNLSHIWSTQHSKNISCDELPFAGGWFLYLGYELAQQIEPHLRLKLPSIPIAYATRIPAAIIYNHQQDTTYYLCEEDFDYIEQMKCDTEIEIELQKQANTTIEITEEGEQQYLNSIKKIKKYIIDGDVFQVNLSRLWEIENSHVDASLLYQKLRETNPAPFSGLAVYNDFSIISSSPERLVSVKNNIAETRPIAGTRRREKDKVKDDALKAELIAHPKERAEHIMLIDLERNDLGRVCKPGSINVNELMVLESYAHVHHIVSNVCGELQEGILPGDVIKAVFPGGTITGCPKVRCMEIISDLETEARGAYTGSMGYLNHNGDMDLNILIRTLTLENNTLSFRAGAGLVADSIAQSELEETRHKARGLLLALE